MSKVTLLSTNDYPSGQYISFNIPSAKEGRYPDIKAIYQSWEFQESLGSGKIYKQQNGHLWYADPNKIVATAITTTQLDLMRRWAETDLLPGDSQFETLRAIGGLPSDPYTYGPTYLQFPAKIRTLDGDVLDHCLIHFSEAPPLDRYFSRVLLLNDVEVLEPSEYALPHLFRLSSSMTQEVMMSFAPFMVRTKDGKFLTYNGTTHFASLDGIKGADIASVVVFSDMQYDHVIRNISPEKITYVIGKWDSRVEELFQEYRKRLGI